MSTPSPRTDSESNQLDDADDVFLFDAPAYYDLKNPALEARYVNNADGYFTPGAYDQLRARYREPPREETEGDNDLDTADRNDGNTHMSDADSDDKQLTIETEDMVVDASGEPATLSLSRSLLQDDDEQQSFEDVFAHYASSSQHSRDSNQEDGERRHQQKPSMPPPLSASSKLLQPTQAFLRRVHTEHALREQQQAAGAPSGDKPLRLTRPKSPTLRTSRKAATAAEPLSRMSYTSRELLKIQEERLRAQMERMKIREFHERTKAQRPPANVHQRSTKQLTIPVSPYLEVGHRTRRCNASDDDAAMGDSNNNSERERPQPFIRPETLLSRDFALPVPPPHHHHHDGHHDVTRPAPPHLLTADRAARRAAHHDEQPREKSPAPDYAAMRVNGVTQPMTPQLLTSQRAQCHSRKAVDVVDEDAVELAKKFHAQPVSRAVLEPRAAPKAAEKPPLTQPVSPKLSTSARVASRQSATERAAAAIADLERRRKEREQQRLRARESSSSNRPPPPRPAAPRAPTIPETPDLKSIRLHRQYQENLRRRLAEEEEQRRKQREFKAQPIRLAPAPPPKTEGAAKPLTEVVPFALPGEQFHQRALERLEAKKREEEARLQAQTQFKAMPMPVVGAHDAGSSGHENARPNSKPPTRFAAPELASDRRALERAAFDAAERERRAREDAYKKELEEEARQRQAEELKQLRRERLVFHARPVPDARAFVAKPSNKPLTEPQSPALGYHPPRSSAASLSS